MDSTTEGWRDKPCQEWNGNRLRAGYGTRTVHGRHWLVHRLAWTETHGPIPDGLQVLHHCDNPPCYEETHLFLGTQKDNLADMMAKGRHRYLVTPKPGESNPQAKLTDQQVLEIRERYATEGVSQRRLARQYGVEQATIGMAVRGETWGHLAVLSRARVPGQQRLTAELAAAIRREHASGASMRALARKYDVNRITIRLVVRGITWRHGG